MQDKYCGDCLSVWLDIMFLAIRAACSMAVRAMRRGVWGAPGPPMVSYQFWDLGCMVHFFKSPSLISILINGWPGPGTKTNLKYQIISSIARNICFVLLETHDYLLQCVSFSWRLRCSPWTARNFEEFKIAFLFVAANGRQSYQTIEFALTCRCERPECLKNYQCCIHLLA